MSQEQEERCTVTQEEMGGAFRVLSEIAKEYTMDSDAFATLTEARRLILVEANELGLDREAIRAAQWAWHGPPHPGGDNDQG